VPHYSFRSRNRRGELVTKKVSAGLGYFAPVDGLRAVAILSVMIFHLRPGLLPGGFVGVDIFFVISGFVVTASVVHLRFDRLRDLLGFFYARRMARILPALLLMLFVTALLSLYFIHPRGLAEMPYTGGAAFLAASNILLAHSRRQYFSPGAELDPFLHTWTLGVEEQFYLVFPFFFYFYQKGLTPGRENRRAIWALGIATLLSLVVCAILTRTHMRQAFYQMPSRFWELGFGMILCLTIDEWRPRLAAMPGRLVAMAAGGCFAGFAIAFVFPHPGWFPFPMALFPAGCAAVLIAIVCARPGALSARALSHPATVFVGKLSYSLYLWHWPVFVLFRWTVGLEGLAHAVAAVGLTFASAAGSYYFVEQPARRAQKVRPLSRKRILASGIAACLVGSLLAGASFTARRWQMGIAANAEGSIPPAWTACPVREDKEGFAQGSHTVLVPQCGQSRPGKLVVVGDSHALVYTHMLKHYASEQRSIVHIYTASGCAFPSLSNPMAERLVCDRFYPAVTETLIRTLEPGDILFMPALRLPRFEDIPLQPTRPREERIAYEESRALLVRLAATGATLIFEAPKPVFRSSLYRCMEWFNRDNPVCAAGFQTSRAEMARLRAKPLRVMSRLSAEVGGIAIWDPLPVLCPADPCSAILDGRILFIDSDHLYVGAVDLLYPGFRDFIVSRRGSRRLTGAAVRP
jgi:peptidoglycan/LPS O-acetylase OafA/YrhL